jgi:hypothetical protein
MTDPNIIKNALYTAVSEFVLRIYRQIKAANADEEIAELSERIGRLPELLTRRITGEKK